MKAKQTVQWIGMLCLLAAAARGGTVAVTPASKTYLQTELTVGTPVSLPITLQGWGTTNLTVSATGGGSIFAPWVSPSEALPQSTARTLYLYPLGSAGNTTVTVTVNASGSAPVSAEVSLAVTPIPLLNGLQATASFNEDTPYSDSFSVTYWGSSSALSWSAVIQTGGDVLQSAVLSGSGLSRTLTLTPRSNKNGAASVLVSVGDGTHSDSQTVAVTVAAVPDAPQVTGLSAILNLQEDVSTQLVFTVTDLDEGDSGAIASTAAVTGGASSLFDTVSIQATTLHLVPHDDAYGWCTVRVVTANSFLTTTNSIRVNVRPVADAPVVAAWPTQPLELDVGGLKITSLFPSVSVTDDDHLAYRNGTSNEYLKATVTVDNQTLLFASGTATSTTNLSAGAVPAAVTSWLHGLSLYPPESTYAPVGTAITNTLSLRVYGFGSNDTLSVTSTVPVILTNRNHPPTFIPSVNPSTIQEGQTLTPFEINNVNDLDAIHTAFTLVLSVRPEDAALAVLSTPGSLYGNASELNTQLRNVGITAMSGVMTTPSTNITVRYVLSDSIDSVTNEVTLVISQAATAPVINGIDELTAYYTVSDIETVIPFPNVITYDVDQGGQQMLRADISVSDPSLGVLTVGGVVTSSFSLLSQSSLQDQLRSLIFEPVSGALAIGSSAEVVLVLTVTDATGLATVNSLTRVFITAVNKPPRVTVPLLQPLLLPPDVDARPFAGILVTNDDVHAMTMTLTLDDAAKGTLSNLGGFLYAGGEYTMSGTLDAINASLTNIIYTLSPLYVFPPDNPGGTLFTLTVEDYQVKLGQAQLWVQIQDAPRNHLVTRTANDGAPGSLLFAVAHASNNDVITFALPEYPAVIRVPAAFGPMVLAASLTLKGPGADLLTISGDSDGDGDADTQLFVVQAHAVFEGLTLAQGTAAFGGAVSVAQSGSFVLKACAIVDCEAAEYGGAIDVEGSLRAEKCYFAGNRVIAMSGGGGGAISFYSPHDSVIVNTTFSSNRVEDAGGYGGGAVYVERLNDASMNLSVTHCTFAGNADASGHASAVFVVGGNSFATLKNTVLSDYSEVDGARNIDVTGDGWVVSEGGNVCDDSTRTAYMQAGGLSVYLLTHVSDQTGMAPGLGTLTQESGDSTPFFPLQINSPALGCAQSSATAVDQRERMRRTVPGDAGAVQHDAAERVAITEIQVSVGAGESDPFIEVYVPRDGFEADLSGFTLYVNGVAAHTFGQGDLALTNSVYPTLVPAADIPASYRLRPGRGVVVVFPKGAVADFDGFSPLNPTPVVRGSQVSDAAAFAQLLSPYGQGTVMIARSAAAAPVVGHAFQTVFIDPEAVSGTSRLDTAQNSIALAPQGRGFAFLPHSSVCAEMLCGWRGRPVVTVSSLLLQSPGATVDGLPFGVLNATPVAVDDAVTVTEDEIGSFFVLENDRDADNDPIILVDVSTGSGPGAGDAAATVSSLGADVTVVPDTNPLRGTHLIYDPRQVAILQALPVGVEILDTFCYEIIDMGSAPVDGIPDGTPSNTWITAVNHRLQSGASVVLSDVSVPAYNGTFTVAVIDEDRFAIPVPFAGMPDEPGAWQTDGPRVPSARSEAVVTVKVTGVNDAPVVTGDVFT
ncbi:MAG: Ig-like domain-containing protein, partial [Kiritimatiellae bacterium]|nr:Ig-like domain-containing protein [Kiritimatiellia bacterium]